MKQDEPDDYIHFTPVPCLRHQARGWTCDAQVAFIQALARCGVVAHAARSVGRSARSAYQLRQRAEAESFAAAWDWAIKIGAERAAGVAIRAFYNPHTVAKTYRGRIIAYVEKPDTRLALAALNAFAARRYGRVLPQEARDTKLQG